ncbi:hypothetical protein ASG11_16775 [Sphingomonas sp. Leaf357]|uniref:hypothetical protein n=1 Tax=Sphingomonas sp. Leaf357 TaxID=1736350 RepID=UPI0006F1FDE9|nr:hypothetical protein [Sphingomonas sp. Leaf357]KQS01340.1 hypothetical protein ASG11_16775 [Sphingomonas sp. Leaf357]
MLKSDFPGAGGPFAIGGAALALCVATLAICWPGVAMYDSVWQYQQALSGHYNDWHPPVMARLWALLHRLGPGAAPMFLAQIVLYWLGLGLWGVALARGGRGIAGLVVLAIGACPVFLGWQVTVLKDAQMAAAMLAATGLIAWWRLAGRAVPVAATVAAGMLLAYSVLVRSNAVFAVVPLAVMLTRWSAGRKLVVGAIGVVLVLAVSPLINHRVFGAVQSGVTRAQPLYDMAGIAHFSRTIETGGLLPEELALIEARHCYKPFFWDSLADPRRCGVITERLETVGMGAVGAAWARAILYHPLAYAEHRIGHLNMTWRFIVPAHVPSAAPPEGGEPNTIGLINPGKAHVTLARAGAWVAETPVGWPIMWIVVAGGVMFAARSSTGPARDLAVALAISALVLEASFAVISIASDLRYHLWAMIASALAAVLMAGYALPRRALWIGGGALALVVAAATAARIALPPGPATYDGMLG